MARAHTRTGPQHPSTNPCTWAPVYPSMPSLPSSPHAGAAPIALADEWVSFLCPGPRAPCAPWAPSPTHARSGGPLRCSRLLPPTARPPAQRRAIPTAHPPPHGCPQQRSAHGAGPHSARRPAAGRVSAHLSRVDRPNHLPFVAASWSLATRTCLAAPAPLMPAKRGLPQPALAGSDPAPPPSCAERRPRPCIIAWAWLLSRGRTAGARMLAGAYNGARRASVCAQRAQRVDTRHAWRRSSRLPPGVLARIVR